MKRCVYSLYNINTLLYKSMKNNTDPRDAKVVRGSSDALQIQKKGVPTGYLPARVDNGIF